MKISKRRLFGIVILLVAVTLYVKCHANSEVKKEDFQESLMKLKNELEMNLSQKKEEPFKLRSFRPYIENRWIGDAVAYGCYRVGQAPGVKGPSDVELLEDLNIIARHWNLIRVYGADNDTRRIIRLIDTHNLPIKVIQGIWLAPEKNDPDQRQANINQVILGIEMARLYPEIVAAISVGNETQVFWTGHNMNFDNLVRYTRAVRNNVAIPVTTADDYLYWNKPESRQLAAEIDFVFTHIHPLWNGKTLDDAINWLDKIYHDLEEIHQDRMIVIGETGWATDYNRDKTGPGEQGTLIKGEVGLKAQSEFLIQLNEWVESNRVTTFLFEAFDEPWKGGGENSPANEVEKHWGVYNEDRTSKESFQKYLDNQNNDEN